MKRNLGFRRFFTVALISTAAMLLLAVTGLGAAPTLAEIQKMSPDQQASWGAKMYPYPDMRAPGATTVLPLRPWNAKSGPPIGADAAPVKESGVLDARKYKKAPPWTIGFSNSSMGYNWRIIMYELFMYRAKQYPEIGQVIVTQADGNVNKQIADIEDLIAKKVDILVVSAGVQDALVPAIEQAYDAGIPVVIFDRDVSTDKYTVNIRLNEYGNGYAEAEFLAKAMGYHGNFIGVLGMAGSSNAIDRWNAVQAILKKYPGIKVAASGWSKAFDLAEAKAIVKGFIATGVKMDAIYAQWLTESLGAIEALQEANLPIPPIVGDVSNQELRLWRDLRYPGLHVSNPPSCSIDAVDAAVLILKGDKLYRDYVNSLFQVTQDTLPQYYRSDLTDQYIACPRLPEDIVQKNFAKK